MHPLDAELRRYDERNALLDGESELIRPKAELVTMSSVERREIEWLWPNRIALGKLSMIAGNPGLGKSLLSIAMAAHISRGSRWPVDQINAPLGDVIMLSAEDDPSDTIAPRLDAAGADTTRVHVLSMVREVDPQTGDSRSRFFSLQTDIDVLEDALHQRPETKLIVIDPISAYTGSADTHRNSDVRALLAPVAELAQRWHIAIVAVTHLNKGSGDPAYRTMGSLAFSAAARCVLAVAKDKDDTGRRLVVPIKNNLGDDEAALAYTVETAENKSPVLAWEPNTVEVDLHDVLSGERDDSRTERQDATDWLVDELRLGPVGTKELQKLANQAGHSWTTVKRAKAGLPIKARKKSFGGGWEWILEEDHQLDHSQNSGPLRDKWSSSGNGAYEEDHRKPHTCPRGPQSGNGTPSGPLSEPVDFT